MIPKGKLVKAVGATNVSYKQEALDAYSRDTSFVNSVKPVCVVRPAKAADVQKIVNIILSGN